MIDKNLQQLQQNLGYEAKDITWLKHAICHKSFAKENLEYQHNEKLEFLGDAVLDLVLSDLLMLKYKNDQEGGLSRKRASIVNEDRLAELGRKFALQEYILLGEGEQANRLHENPRIIASALEAIIGAIYKDQGYENAYHWIEDVFAELLDEAFDTHDFEKDYKTRLQEWVQEAYKVTPRYRVIEQSGPDHAREFRMEVFVNEESWGIGEGKSKKAAAQDAAKKAMKRKKK